MFPLLFVGERIHGCVCFGMQRDCGAVLSYVLPRKFAVGQFVVPENLMVQVVVTLNTITGDGELDWRVLIVTQVVVGVTETMRVGRGRVHFKSWGLRVGRVPI